MEGADTHSAQLAAKDAEIKELTEQQQHFGRLAREHYEQLQAQIDAQATTIARLREACVDALSSLVAAISLLEKGGKKAAPSDKMFAQMLVDYNNSVARTRAALTENTNGN